MRPAVALPLNTIASKSAPAKERDKVKPVSDADLVNQAKAGDVHAFEALYQQNRRRVFSLCLRVVNDIPLAEDLTQEAFLQVYRKLHTFRGDSSFSTWVHRLAVNVVIERFRTERTRRARLHDGEEIFNTIAGPPMTRDIGLDFEAALAQLPDGAREIFVLHDVEGYKHREIAEMLGIATGTSKRQLHRARMLMRRHLGGR